MSIFKNIFNNNNNKQPVNDPIFDYIVNYVSSDDFDVDSQGAINLSSDIYSITTRIANDVANKQIVSTNSYVADLLNNHINQYTNAHDFWVGILMNMLIYGDGFGLIESNGTNGTISGVQLLPSYKVTILQGANGLSYQYNNETYSSDQMIHLRFDPLTSLHGSNPLRALRSTLKLSRASNKLLQSYMNDTAYQKVLLQADGKLNSEDREKLRRAFSKSTAAGGCLVSDSSVKISPFSSTNVSAETVRQLKANDSFKKAIASVYGVSYELLGVVNSHSNGQDLFSRYRIDLKRYEHIITAELNNKLNGTYDMKDPIEPLNVSDVANLVKSGAINAAEAKQYLGF